MCDKLSLDAGGDTQMSVKEFVGPLFTYMIFILVGLALNSYWKVRRRACLVTAGAVTITVNVVGPCSLMSRYEGEIPSGVALESPL